MKNKIMNTIMLSITLAIGVLIGMNAQTPVKAEIKNVNVEYKARGEQFKIENKYTQEDGDTITEYNNGSWSVYNETENKYEFCPVELGDWSYALGNKKELDNIIETYKEIYETGEY